MTLFKNALLSDQSYKDILVHKGTIQEINSFINTSVKNTIDCEGRLLLSGMIDVHVHFRDPGFPQKEDATSGTKAAIRGGVTTIIDMPNTSPLCVGAQELADKRTIYQEKAYANYGFHFGGDARDNSSILNQINNIASLKIFLNESTGHMLVTDDKILDRLFANSSYISVHAEGDAVDKAIYYAKKHRNILYLCHISQAEELQLIQQAKSQNLPIFAEVCPHHVLFNTTDETDKLIMKPRLRTPRDQEALLKALDSGLIDTWGTDHAPHLLSEKEAQLTYGIPSIEFSLELLLTLAKEMNWSYQKVEQLYSSRPRNIFKIAQKGAIVPSYDADFVLIDPNTSYHIKEKDIVSKCAWSPYVGRLLNTKIHSTYIGGEEVYNAETKKFNKSNYIKELNYER